MTTLVTGGTGFVGRFVVEALLRDGHPVRVMGRTGPAAGFFPASVEFVHGTLDPDADHAGLMEGVTGLVHAAFDHLPGKYRGGEGSNPEGFRRKNLDGTIALFEAARRAGVARVAFLSSRAVYGTQPRGAELDETSGARADTLYGEVKLGGERALAELGSDGFRGVSLRVTGVYGAAAPGERHKWSSLFEDYLAGRAIEPRRATEVHGDDVARAVLIALGAPSVPGVLNVSDLIVDRRDLLAIVRDATGSRHPLPERSREPVNAMTCGPLSALGWKPGGGELLARTVRQMLERR